MLAALLAVSFAGQAAEADTPKKDDPKPKAEGETPKKEGVKPAADGKAAEKTVPEVPKMKVEKGDWCEEHGVPESLCSRCNKKAIEAYKEKGDWCKKHGRAASQCFICYPELKDKWATLKPKE